MARILRLPAVAVETVARHLTITDHVTGTMIPWAPNPEQRRLWKRLERGGWLFAGKPRRIGITTATQLEDMLFCQVNDRAGQRVRAGLFTDAEAKLKEHEVQARLWVQQAPDLFHGVDVNSDRVLWPGGSVLEFHTGGGKSAGRGGGYHRIHLTELPFWPTETAYHALLPSMTMQCQVIIETTIDIAAPCGPLVRSIWDNPKNHFNEAPDNKLFFSVEDHPDYVADPSRITDEQWAWCQEEGFTKREAASWWLTDCLPNLCADDLHRLYREFPQTEAHMLSGASGLWFKKRAAVAEHRHIVDIEGSPLFVFRELAQTSRQLVIGVDVAAGKGGDASAIAVLDKRDASLVACLKDNTMLTTTLARATKIVSDLYTTVHPSLAPGILAAPQPTRPDVEVETNGVGAGPMQYMRELGIEARDVHVADASVIYDCLLRVKAEVEAGRMAGPQDLAAETGVIYRDPITGKFKGAKDLSVAIGHALRRINMAPYKEPPKPPDRETYISGAAMIKAAQRKRPVGW